MHLRSSEATFERLCWTGLALGCALLPHLPVLPVWISLTIGIAAGIRLLLAHHGRRLPPAVLRLAISAIAITLLFIQFHTFNGISAGSALLALMAGLKLLEARSLRDLHIILLIAYFLCLTALLVGTSFLLLFYELAVCWLTSSVLLRMTIASPSPTLRDSVRFSGRLLLLSLPLATAFWLFFPRFSGPLWSLPNAESAAISGLGDRMSPGDLSELSLSDEVAFRVRFRSIAPPPAERYWRGPVLDEFDGHAWSRSDSAIIGDRSMIPAGPAYAYTLSLEPHRHNWLFALDWPQRWNSARAYLNSDRMLVQSDALTQPVDLEVVSHTQSRDAGTLNARERRRQTMLPELRNPRTRELALELRARSASDWEFSQSALRMFRVNQFFYTLTPPRLGTDSVDEFLFDTKKGFCEHYASAFAALMRAGGVPARVVTGYQGGTFNRFAGYWIVRQSDAHAWTEIWIEGRGWVRADPTAAIAPERIERGSAATAAQEGMAVNPWFSGAPWFEELRLRIDALRQMWRDAILRFDQRSQLSILESLQIPGPDSQKLVLALAIALILTSLWLAWQLRRDVDAVSHDPVIRAFRKFERKAAAAGIPAQVGEPALKFSQRISQRRPDLAGSAREICEQYNALRYGRTRPDAGRIGRFSSIVRRFKA